MTEIPNVFLILWCVAFALLSLWTVTQSLAYKKQLKRQAQQLDTILTFYFDEKKLFFEVLIEVLRQNDNPNGVELTDMALVALLHEAAVRNRREGLL